MANFGRSWVARLTETASAQGFQAITRDTIQVNDVYRPFWNQSNLMALEDFGTRMEGEEARETRRLMKVLGTEFASGASVDAEFFCLVGRRPL